MEKLPHERNLSEHPRNSESATLTTQRGKPRPTEYSTWKQRLPRLQAALCRVQSQDLLMDYLLVILGASGEDFSAEDLRVRESGNMGAWVSLAMPFHAYTHLYRKCISPVDLTAQRGPSELMLFEEVVRSCSLPLLWPYMLSCLQCFIQSSHEYIHNQHNA